MQQRTTVSVELLSKSRFGAATALLHMKVLLISGSFPPMRCGVGDYTSQLADALASDPALQLAVLTSRRAVPGNHSGEYLLIPAASTWSWYEIAGILRATLRWRPDIVHIQYPTLGYGRSKSPWLLPILLRVLGIAVVWTCHGFRFDELSKGGPAYALIIRALGAITAGIVVVRSKDAELPDSMTKRWLYRNKALRFIPNASVIPAVILDDCEKDDLRRRYARENARLIVYFGFLYPPRRVDLLFQVVDPADSHLVIIGDEIRTVDGGEAAQAYQGEHGSYREFVTNLTRSAEWNGRSTMTGFLPPHEAARLIAAADAVVLPTLGGSGEWSTSLHAARAQGTFVLTTSKERRGYYQEENTYYVADDDIDGMKEALRTYAGTRCENRCTPQQTWTMVGESHADLYRCLLKN